MLHEWPSGLDDQCLSEEKNETSEAFQSKFYQKFTKESHFFLHTAFITSRNNGPEAKTTNGLQGKTKHEECLILGSITIHFFFSISIHHYSVEPGIMA